MTLYCDSSLREACYVFVGGDNEIEEPIVLPYDNPVTVNVGEYKAAIIALEAAKSRKLKGLTLFTDSQLMTNQVYGLWKCHAKLLPYRNEVRVLLGIVRGSLQWISREKNLAGVKLEEVKRRQHVVHKNR